MPNDLQFALQCQAVYDGQIPLRTVSETAYSRIDDANGITLIFRGTSDMEDRKRDLEALMVTCSFGRVHGGAWKNIQAILDIENLPNDETIIFLIGHSLGAMEAQLAYRELYQRGYKNIKCVTFECPRFGDHQAIWCAQSLNSDNTYQNYKNLFEHDAFTMIPLWLVGEPYVDVPNCKQFWQAPTANNEFKDWPLNIQAHSISDCVIPYLKTVFP